MEILLAQGITETIQVQSNPEATQKPPTTTEEQAPIGGGIREEITLPAAPPSPTHIPFNSWGDLQAPSLPTLPALPSLPTPSLPPISPSKLPLGTITEKFIYPSIPNIPATVTPSTDKKMNPSGLKEEVHQQPSGQFTYIREICDGEIHIGNFKSCLKEFTGVSAVGWIAAAAGLIVLWKWLEWKFKK